MKLLLDECVPQRLRDDFPNHEVFSAAIAGLLGVKNGALLRAAAADFDVLITVDQKMPFQQNVQEHDLAVIVLIATPCRYPQLKLLAPKVLDVLERIKPGDIVEVE
jgi:predicted nuclease of predicted toxin-antitoxin system